MKKKYLDKELFDLLLTLPKRKNIVRGVGLIDFVVGVLFFYGLIYPLVSKQEGITRVVSGLIFVIVATLFFVLFLKKSKYFKENLMEWKFTIGYLFFYFIIYYVIAIGLCMFLSLLGVISYQI